MRFSTGGQAFVPKIRWESPGALVVLIHLVLTTDFVFSIVVPLYNGGPDIIFSSADRYSWRRNNMPDDRGQKINQKKIL